MSEIHDAHDAQDFDAALFEHQLQLLVDITRPKITALTQIAQECTQHAHIIMKLLVQRILAIPHAQQRLPPIYLLDSIIKLAGPQYATLFIPHAIHVMGTTFDMADQMIREKIIKVIRLWMEMSNASVIWPQHFFEQLQQRLGVRIEPSHRPSASMSQFQPDPRVSNTRAITEESRKRQAAHPFPSQPQEFTKV